MQVANDEHLRALILLECADVEEGRDMVQRLAARGTSRRYAYEANDCVVRLAALALVEHDDETARDLVLTAGTGSGWSAVVADHLAHRLDVVDQRRRRILESLRSRDATGDTR